MSMYCTYLTVYKGNKMPPFYIGYTSINNINKGYRGSVSSKKYKQIWKQELKENPDLFTTKVISLHEDKEEAKTREEELQRKMNVIKNTMYINRAIGRHYDNTGNKHSEESKKKMGRKGKTGPNKGKKLGPWTEQQKSKLKGRVPWCKGKKLGQLPIEQREKISKSLKKYVLENGGTWNKGLTGLKGYTKGMSWYYNSITNERAMFIEGEQPNNWLKGMGISRNKKVWYYNPINNTETIFIEENNQPTGWLRGRGVTGKRNKGKLQ